MRARTSPRSVHALAAPRSFSTVDRISYHSRSRSTPSAVSGAPRTRGAYTEHARGMPRQPRGTPPRGTPPRSAPPRSTAPHPHAAVMARAAVKARAAATAKARAWGRPTRRNRHRSRAAFQIARGVSRLERLSLPEEEDDTEGDGEGEDEERVPVGHRGGQVGRRPPEGGEGGVRIAALAVRVRIPPQEQLQLDEGEADGRPRLDRRLHRLVVVALGEVVVA
mmetsp:Transcript_75856/g.209313  ORF Transcript_75856/g.209313 Transcript_75856/m.209313 type:complete len:222 (+) Transcript_75856:300-965(+)